MADPRIARRRARPLRRTASPRHRPTRWRAIALPAAVLLAAAMLPAAAAAQPSPTNAGGGAPPQPQGAPCANPSPPPPPTDHPKPVLKSYDASEDPLSLPPWSDAGGWVNASQYESILTGDLDGDGRGELLGRNGSSMETWTSAPPERRPDQAPYLGADPNTWPKDPGQWVMKEVTNPPPAGQGVNEPNLPEGSVLAQLSLDYASPTAAVPGFSDASRYMTFRLANVIPGGGEELIVRQPIFSNQANPPVFTGSYLTIYTFANGQWSYPKPFIQLNDLSSPGNYLKWGPQPTDTSNGVWGTPWFMEQYYSSISTADLDGNGVDEIVVRGADGLHEFAWVTNGFAEVFDTTNGGGNRLLQDGQGFDQPLSYKSLRFADLDGDKRDEVILMGSGFTSPGVITAHWSGTGTIGGWSWGPGYLPWQTWTQPQQYETISVGDLNGDGRADVFGQGPSGLDAITLKADNSAFIPMVTAPMALPASSGGVSTDWSQAPYYSTIQAGDVNGSSADEVLARAADGVHTYSLAGFSLATATPGNFQQNVPVLTQLSDANGWLDPSKYSTIKTAMVTKGDRRVLIGRDRTGMRTFVLPQQGANQWTAPSVSFPSWAGGDDPNSHGDGTPLGLAYKYINDQIAFKMNWGTPTHPGDPVPDTLPTIRSKFVTGSGVSNWFDIATNIEALQPDAALSIDRDSWNAVQRSMADWARDVGTIWSRFFTSASGQSIESAMLTALVLGDVGNPVSNIQQAYTPDGHTKLWVWLADLLWGVVGAVGDAFLPGVSEADSLLKSAVKKGSKFAVSVMAAGGSAAVSNYAPDSTDQKQGQLNQEAQYLDQVLVSSFCNGISFLYGSADQAATDLGLLTAMGQSLRAAPIEPTYEYPNLVGQLTNQRTIWVNQQFASMNVSGVGWALGRADTDKASNIIGPHIPVGDQTYAVTGLGGKCDDDHAKAQVQSLQATLGLDLYDLAQPTWSYWSASDPGGKGRSVGDPNKRAMDPDGATADGQKMGTGGWRLPVGKHCS